MADWNFPINPTVGQRYEFGTKTWEWNGSAWDLIPLADYIIASITEALETSENAFDASQQAIDIAEEALEAVQGGLQGTIKRPPGGVPVIATEGQTTFNIEGGIGSLQGFVYLNGVKISPPDIDLSGDAGIVFNTPLSQGDEVDWMFFAAFSASQPPTAGEIDYIPSEVYPDFTIGGELQKQNDQGPIYASRLGVVGDWNVNTNTGTDNTALIVQGINESAASGRQFIIDVRFVGCKSIRLSNKHQWDVKVTGSLHNMETKPFAGAGDAKNGFEGTGALFFLDHCDYWELSGSHLDPGYRETFFIINSKGFDNNVKVIGRGVNDNLDGSVYRYCNDFRIGTYLEAVTKKPETGYYQWCNATKIWDSSNFVITSKYFAKSNGGNGLYVGSNCKDWSIEDGATCTVNAMSGIQLAWSSFGVFPYRFKVGAMLLNGNRADGIDVNNTDGTVARIDGIFSNYICVNNGYNDDGTVTADGSGIGTFMNVSHFTVIDAQSTDSARAGLYVKNCTDFKATGWVKKQKETNNIGEGVYLERCSNYTVEVDAEVRPDMEVLKTFGIHRQGKIGGKLVGTIAISSPDLNTIYDDVQIYADIQTTNPVTSFLEVTGGSVYCTGTALYATKNVSDCKVTALNGIGLIYAASNVRVDNCLISGYSSGTNCTDYQNCSLSNSTVSGDINGPASHWINAAYMTLEDNIITNTGGANSLRIEANCTHIWAKHNVLVGPAEVLPPLTAFDMNV